MKRRLRIGLDARAYFWTGVGRYVRNLLEQYRDLDVPAIFEVLVPEGKSGMIRDEHQLPEGKFILREVESEYYTWREQLVLPWQLREWQVDVAHWTHFNVPFLARQPYVVTVHDVTRFFWPGQREQGWGRQVAYEAVFAAAVRRAQRILCVSQSTKDDLLGLPLDIRVPVDVMYEGVEERFAQEVPLAQRRQLREWLKWDGEYALYVGVWMNHKNLRRMLEALVQIRDRFPQVRLIITGKYQEGYVPLEEMVAELGLQEQVFLVGFVPDELLPALYQEAAMFWFPSLYEGFGLPVLEASTAGCPVLTSNVSSLPEILEDAAWYVNPDSVESVAAGMADMLAQAEKRERLAQLAREKARRFSWRVCAEETYAVYERVAGSG